MNVIKNYQDSFDEIKCLGSGGFGNVFKVKEKLTSNEFAVKKIVFQEDNEELNKYIIREISILSKLSGECIVQYIESWTQNDCVYIQMQLMDDNFRHILELKNRAFNRYPNQAFTPLEYYISCEIFVEILESIQYLHSLSPPLIHRDLKPENILISYNKTNGGFLKICDFGLSVVHDKTSMTHTSRVGTDNCSAPEVKNGRKYDTKADVYSTGIIARELFDITDDDKMESIKQLRMDQNMRDLYHELRNKINSMIETTTANRLTISQVLATAMDWSISKDNVKQWTDFEPAVNRMKSFGNKFFSNYFAFKYQIK